MDRRRPIGEERVGVLKASIVILCLLCTPTMLRPHSDPSHASSRAQLRLYVEPRDGVDPLVRAIDAAQSYIFVDAYILTNRRIVHALERAAAQDVAVDVLLEPRAIGMGRQPERVADQLRAAGVAVRWPPRRYPLMHAKLMDFDDRLAVISTANFSLAGFSSNREFLVFDRERIDIRQVSAIFRADWDGLPARNGDRGLVVSPGDSRSGLMGLILSARRSLRVYAEEITDRAVEGAFTRAVRRGVRVRVMLAAGQTPANARRLRSRGVMIHETSALYIHAKAIVVDGNRAFVGSENFSAQSLDRNREVGLIARGPIARSIAHTFDKDWKRSATAR